MGHGGERDNLPGPTPIPGQPSDYQKLDYYGEDACPEGLEMESESECSEAIAALGIADGGTPWTESCTTMPRGCSLQKATDSIFQHGRMWVGTPRLGSSLQIHR